MTDHSDSRSLLLERLESRCMLAAGLFAHSVDHDGDLNRRSEGHRNHGPDGRQGAEIRRVGDAGNPDHRPAPGQHQRHQNNGGRPDRSSPPPRQAQQGLGRANPVDDVLDHGIKRQETPVSTPLVQSAAASTSNPPSSNPLASNPPTSNFPGFDPGLRLAEPNQAGEVQSTAPQENSPRNQAPVDSGVTAPASRGQVLTAISAPIDTDTNVSAADRVVDVASTLDAMAEARESLNFDTDRTSDVDRFLNPSIDSYETNSSSIWDGLIEPQLGLQNELLREESTSDDATWEIRDETLKQLRDLATDPSVEKVGETNQLTDQVIASWFEGAGGLVDIGTTSAPLIGGLLGGPNFPIQSGSVSSIALDATLGLHRSVNLISGDVGSSDQTVGDGEAVRDAVLAAIAGEASSPVSPIGVEATPKLSSIAYPGAVILASTLAIIGRRKKVRLFSSKDPAKKS